MKNPRKYYVIESGRQATYAQPMTLDEAKAEVQAWVVEEKARARRRFGSEVKVSRTATGARIELGANLWGSIEILEY